MGLGPNHSSLLDRTGHPARCWSNPFMMQCEQIDRGEARREKAIWHATHRAQPKRPEAPATPHDKVKGQPRMWIWEGEDISSKQLFHWRVYTAEQIRKAGFKLPKLIKKGGEK